MYEKVNMKKEFKLNTWSSLNMWNSYNLYS